MKIGKPLSSSVILERPAVSSVKPTPFHGAASGWNATNRWTSSGEFTVSAVYSSLSQEYEGVQSFAAVRDLTPMPKYHIQGHNIVDFLSKLVVSNVQNWEAGKVYRTAICDENGYVIDIVRVIYNIPDDIYIIGNISIYNWLYMVSTEFDLVLTDITDSIAVLGLYGPYARHILADLDPALGLNPPEQSWFRMRAEDIEFDCLTETELGTGSMELWVNMEDAFVVWERVMRAGRSYAIRPVGELAYDQCRIETGLPRTNVDFISPASAIFGNRPRTPFELALKDDVSFSGPYFNGKNALMKKAGMLRSHLVGLKISGRRPVTGARIIVQGGIAGTVTSSTWSPRFLTVIGLATIEARFAKPGTEVSLELPTSLELKPHTGIRKGVVAALPFS